LSAKTASAIPKSRIFAAVAAANSAHYTAPINTGDILLTDIADTGVDLIATKSLP
jgi:CxxC motif-containing protein